MTAKSTQPLVSVIIPVYNCERYIQECLDSIYAQTYDNLEIIIVNDGSTDKSLSILRTHETMHANITLVDQENHGQGHARNTALKRAKGEYVIFVDADDYIEPETVEKALNRAHADDADVVHFDWKMLTEYPDGSMQLSHFNVESFSHKLTLVGDECDEFMDMKNYFSVNNLFRRSFLVKFKIRYDEGHIYEDVLFVVSVANSASKISFIHEPLYVVRKNITSTTHSHVKTDKHYKDFLRAVEKSFAILKPRTAYTAYYLCGYFLEKFIIYYERRVPKAFHGLYLKNFVDLMSTTRIDIPHDTTPKRFLELCVKKDVFSQRKYATFKFMLLYKTAITPHHHAVKNFMRRKIGK